MGLAAVATGALLATVNLSSTYNTKSIVGMCVAFMLICVIGFLFHKQTMQHFRPLVLLCALVYFGFIMHGCPCILFYFQGFVLFIAGKSAFWLSFAMISMILVLSVIFGSIWCGWLCWLGALQEFIFQKSRWNLLKTQKSQKLLLYIQLSAIVVLVLWIIISQRPVLCSYDPFISIVRLKIFNWIGYITVPLLLVSSLLIYRPFCRILCPIGLLLYAVKYLPFAKQMKVEGCTRCRKCHAHCKLNAIHNSTIEKTCIMCGECKKANCSFLSVHPLIF